jgi:poly(A) polymerase
MTAADPRTKDVAAYDAAKSIVIALKEQGHEALLAGGCVRDRLLGKVPKDYDVATSATPDEVCKIFKRTKKVGAKFGVVLVSHRRHEIEVATFRTDGIYRDGRRPEEVTFTDAEHDAQRRDFTINGMFYDPVIDQLVDYVNGQTDLTARVIRCIGDPSKRFAEDHLRLMRAVRFATTLGFAIESHTLEAIQKHAEQIEAISPERVRAELALMLTSPNRVRAWNLLGESHLLNHIIKGVKWDGPLHAQVREMLELLPQNSNLAVGLATILSPMGLDQSNRIARACCELRCSNEETATVCLLLEWARRFDRGCRFELADIKLMLATQRFDDICNVASAWMTATHASNASIAFVRQRACGISTADVAPPPLLDGAFLLEQNVPQGPVYRRVLDAVYRTQLNETITTVEQAQAMAIDMIKNETD